MTDLVTRLRALADADYAFVEDINFMLREAANALERANALWDHETKRADDAKAALSEMTLHADQGEEVVAELTTERDALRAKLAEAEERVGQLAEARADALEQRNSYFSRAQKAEAEAAALREALSVYAYLDCGDTSCMFADERAGMRTNGGCCCFGERSMKAKPTAIKEHARKALCQPGPGAEMLERVKKLEAAAEIQKARAISMWAAKAVSAHPELSSFTVPDASKLKPVKRDTSRPKKEATDDARSDGKEGT